MCAEQVCAAIQVIASLVAAVAAAWALILFIWERKARLQVVWGRVDKPLSYPSDDILSVRFQVANGSALNEELRTVGSYVDADTDREIALHLFHTDIRPASGQGPLLTKPTTFAVIAGHSTACFFNKYKPQSTFKPGSCKITVSGRRQSFTWTSD